MNLELRQKRRELDAAWEELLAGGNLETRKIRPMVRESWLRSRANGVDPSLRAAPILISDSDLDDRRRSDLRQAGEEVIRRMFEAADHDALIASILDEQGQLVCTCFSSGIEDACRGVGVVVGSGWGEAHVGTQGGTSLVIGQATRLGPGEQYCYAWRNIYSDSEVLRDPFTRRVIGVLCVDSWEREEPPRARQILRWGKDCIEQALRDRMLADRLHLFEQYCRHETKYPSEAILAVDKRGIVVAASPTVTNLLRLPSSHLLSQPVSLAIGREIGSDESEEWQFLRPAANGASIQMRVVAVSSEGRINGRIVAMQTHRLSARKVGGPSWQAAYTFEDLIGTSVKFQQVVQRARSIASTEFPVLLCGESGTGKELFAHAIHNGSARKDGPFVPVNCGAVSDELMGAELFGYVEGAFTGAARGGSRGKIEIANGGTLFLDEIASMSPKMQVALLRVLEDGVVVAIGAMEPRRVDVRVIAAINQDPFEAIAAGLLRSDLYYRLAGTLLKLPALRERPEDIPLLVQRILQQANPRMSIAADALEAIVGYAWPGNIRELKNVLLQAANLDADSTLRLEHLPALAVGAAGRGTSEELAILARAERGSIIQTIEESGGRLSVAASLLGIHRTTLYRKMQRHGIAIRSKYPGAEN